MTGLFSRETRSRIRIRPGELQIVLWAAAWFFFVLAGYSILRPLREQMGLAGGVGNLPYLFLATLGVMLVANPLYGALVSRLPRHRFIPLIYRFFMSHLLLFFALRVLLPVDQQIWVGRAFFVWLSVFNLFVISVFWSFLADNFGSEGAKRLYAWIAVGGTLGSLAGSFFTWGGLQVFASLQREDLRAAALPTLMLVSVLLLEVAVRCMQKLGRLLEQAAAPGAARANVHALEHQRILGGGAFEGLLQVARSPYLRKISLYLLCYTITGSLLYFVQAQVVAGHFASPADRTQAFALIDLFTQGATLALQVFLTSRLIAAFGLGRTLGVLPLTAALAFLALALTPSFWVLVVVQVLRRSARYAITKPAREVLFSALEPSEKYKAKAVIDTFVYRSGDALAAGAYRLLGLLGLGVGAVAALSLPLTAGWVFLALALGRAHGQRAAAIEERARGSRVPLSGFAGAEPESARPPLSDPRPEDVNHGD